MNEIAKVSPFRPTAPGMQMILRPQSFQELVTFANMAARTSMVPKDYQGKPENVMLAVQMGSELGLAPMQALQNIACVNGRPAVWGDAMPGLCRQSPVCQDIKEWFDGEGEALTAYCEATRHGASPVRHSFSVADAKKAGLWNKPGPWQQYPRRMLQMRARGFALRDAFPDVLRGLISAEEARDIPPDTFTGPTIEAQAEAAPTPAPAPARQTVRQFLDGLEAELTEALAGADAADAVAAILARDDVQKAQASLSNGALKRLTGMIETARGQIGDEHDPWVIDMIARLDNAMTTAAVQAVIGNDEVQTRRDWLHSKRPALSERLEAAIDRAVMRIEAASRAVPADDTDDVPF